MKKVLLISSLFPPAGGVGVQRNLKYVKYLPQFGWQTFVLTIKSDYFFLQDEELLKDIPKNTRIFRTSCLKPKQRDFSWVKLDTEKKLDRKNKIKNVLRSIIKFIEKEIIIPDIWIGWFPFALFTGNKMAKRNKINVIFCSGPAFTSFLIGYILSKISKLPLVLDYRDGWILNTDKQTYSCNTFKKMIISTIEKTILKHASQIIFVSESLLENYCQKFEFIKKKSNIITNGFDINDFYYKNPSIIPSEKKRVVISDFGNCSMIGRKHFIALLLDIVKNIADHQNNLQDKLKIMFIGIIPQDMKKQIKNHYHLENIIKTTNFVPHNQALKLMQDSDILLLLVDISPNNKDIFSGKLFEYLGARKPILAFGPKDGAAAKVIRETKSGIVIDYETETKKEMIEKTSSFIGQVLNNQFKIDNNKSLKKYERKELTHQLADILDISIAKN